MPIYEYHCESCGSDFERLLKNRDESVKCECGSDKVKRVMSVFAAHNGSSGHSSAPAPACTSCCQGGSCAFNN